MSLAFFIYAALDLLNALEASVTPAERAEHVDWIYRCQLPEGGFRAFPGSDFGKLRNDQNRKWDPPNLPATFFAMQTLAVLKDDFHRLDRRGILEWIPNLQREDGSFGQHVVNGIIEGGHDSRFGYMAAGIRWMLRGNIEGPLDGIRDIGVERFWRCIEQAQTYDGGISDAPFHEAHAGFEYCATSALSLLGCLPECGTSSAPPTSTKGLTQVDLMMQWLVSRQTTTLDEEDEFDTNGDETDTPSTCHDSHSFVKLRSFPSKSGEISYRERPAIHFELLWAGFNGRLNKVADTCYGWWVLATLAILNKQDLVDQEASRRYLLDKAQHMIGGFGKIAGDPPDIYHSYLGLAALALHRDSGLKEFDPALCLTKETRYHLESLPWRKAVLSGAPDSLNTSFSSTTSDSTEETSLSRESSDMSNLDTKYSYLRISGG
ncbi:MAG: hypothetical protein M1822_002928 [Bathelium mastoideum]|nr:MAG: hypothetical protein M1822_002928 [Bathelium mastoideum]